jgi:hypothetical protein
MKIGLLMWRNAVSVILKPSHKFREVVLAGEDQE